MGRSGDRIRMAKDQKTTYTFTKAQLEEHDRQVFREKWKQYENLTKKEAAEIDLKREEELRNHVNKTWDDNAINLLQYTMAISCRVLIEQFGWKPIPKTLRGPEMRIQKFANALAAEIDQIYRVDRINMQQYSEETKKLYNLSFNVNAEGEDDIADDT